MTRALAAVLTFTATLAHAQTQGVDTVWTLTELNGTPFPATATLVFDAEGRFSGQAPCNRYSSGTAVPPPAFQAEPILSTRMACPDLDAETAYFLALSSMTEVRIAGDVMTLTNPHGDALTFTATE